jgi:hypothetical protein
MTGHIAQMTGAIGYMNNSMAAMTHTMGVMSVDINKFTRPESIMTPFR